MLGAPLIERPGDAPLVRKACIPGLHRNGGAGRISCLAVSGSAVRAALCIVAAVMAALLGSAIPALAAPGETVSMPYTCRVAAGQVQLDPSVETSYRILGKREAQTLRVCSGSSAASCRALEIYRFAIECNGNVVQWIDAAAAAIRGQPWRATLSDGLMTLHSWPDGPAKGRRLPLTLPSGFAPAPSNGWRFALLETSTAETSVSPASSSAAPRSERHSEIGQDLPAGSSPPSSATRTFSPRLPGDQAHASTSPAASLNQPMGKGWSAVVVVGDDSTFAAWWSPLSHGAGQHAVLAVIGIAALLLSASALAARQHVPLRFPGASLSRDARDPDGTDQSAPPKSASPPPPPLPRTSRSPELADPVTQLASALAATPPALPQPLSDWDAVIEMRATAEALLDLVRQMIADHVPAGALRDVLIADVDAIADRLDGSELAAALAQGRLDHVHPIYTQAVLDLERVRTLARIEHQRALEAVGEPSRTPETMEEACAFLGINPRAGQPMVKKVVDALRQNWHPDLAEDEVDRRVREERIKRINAAWDLVRAR